MKKFLTIFFVTLGVIFFIIILFGIYFYVTDPLNLKPLFFGSGGSAPSATIEEQSTTDSHPALSEEQEQALEMFGVDPANVPSEITPEQEACFVEILGQARVDEIKAGDSPTASEYFQGRECL